jgi:hypothetical protein
MSAPAEQLQFVWRAARYISLCAKPAPSDATAADRLTTSKADELSALLALRTAVVDALPGDQKGHFSISEAALEQLGREAAEWAVADSAPGPGASVSAISLATVGEALEVGHMQTAAGQLANWVSFHVTRVRAVQFNRYTYTSSYATTSHSNIAPLFVRQVLYH